MTFIAVFCFGEVFQDGEGLGGDAAAAVSAASDDLFEVEDEAVDESPVAVVLFVVGVGCGGGGVEVAEKVDGEEHCGGEDLEIDDVAHGDEWSDRMADAVVIVNHFPRRLQCGDPTILVPSVRARFQHEGEVEERSDIVEEHFGDELLEIVGVLCVAIGLGVPPFSG